ncbi:actin depolymerizing protein [Suillus clintonianus]|uniref:actin depolymerizing protein n=1 Tax=Suillus clintonianus TaxID=1904413 RepID=UPI001B85C24B|nr:actin depolymerizing protein [Suillus clintonianus]KAG2120031.1 actin depolymerizing protein [Suillus clintonianus]
MAATSGIGVSPELTKEFADAVETKNVRFIKVIIQDESLVSVTSLSVTESLNEDLVQLQDHLEEKEPCYILARLDDPPSEWLAISYVPDFANVRDKTLYASTRGSLTKSLGSTVFTDSLFATSKADVTPESYEAHKKHQAAPKPLSAREQEIANIKAAEREAGNSYEGSNARKNHIGQRVGLSWSSDAEDAVKGLGSRDDSRIVILKIEPSTESLELDSFADVTVDHLSSSIPSDQPSYVFYAWTNSYSQSGGDIVFIYSCPTTSPVRYRMLYSSAAMSTYLAAKDLLAEIGSTFPLATKRIETSDPTELDEAFLKTSLNHDEPAGSITNNSGARQDDPAKPSFAKPRGPARRR